MSLRWVSLIVVMSGVALVGLSGSLIKDTVKEALVSLLNMPRDADLPPPEPIDKPEATTVLVGEISLPSQSSFCL